MVPKRTPRFSFAPQAAPAKVNLLGGYTSEWKRLRNRRLDAEPLCRHCSAKGFVTPAVEVDHIKPRALGGLDLWENTQSLCKPCHINKTREDVKKIRRGY
jgi:5-methylcytosine-specific restriction endonuclease McrA